MKIKKTFFILYIGLLPSFGWAATCSKNNLTKCLDSVCAINITMNPAARCQYCGTSNAGTPDDSELSNVSIGQSAKYTINARELKSAPTDPGRRYMWATEKCLEKISDCNAEDVSNTYDKLIEQSCTAAGISAQINSLAEKSHNTKVSQTKCNTIISTCLLATNKCDSNFSSCLNDNDFERFFAECSVDATGCDEHISNIRSDLASNRKQTIANHENTINDIATSYQTAREKKLSTTSTNCKNGTTLKSCVQTVCNTNMKHKCDTGYESETSMATQLCQFHRIACDLLK